MTERKIALSIEEAADYTGIGRNTLRKLVEWKKLPVLKVGRKVLIKTDILEKFMEANEGRDLRDKGKAKNSTACLISCSPSAALVRISCSLLTPTAGHRLCWETEPNRATSTPCRQLQIPAS